MDAGGVVSSRTMAAAVVVRVALPPANLYEALAVIALEPVPSCVMIKVMLPPVGILVGRFKVKLELAVKF